MFKMQERLYNRIVGESQSKTQPTREDKVTDHRKLITTLKPIDVNVICLMNETQLENRIQEHIHFYDHRCLVKHFGRITSLGFGKSLTQLISKNLKKKPLFKSVVEMEISRGQK